MKRSEGAALARALSKLGYCSRSQAIELVRAGRVRVNGALTRDPRQAVDQSRDRIEVDGKPIREPHRIYVALNKPRGLVTTAKDERDRETVYSCFEGAKLPHLAPVGRLDRASEGLLLFTNDTRWAAGITDPERHVEKTYHVQVGITPDDALVERLQAGVTDEDESLRVVRASVIRTGVKNGWIEIVLDQGKNRQIRRMLAALEVEVLRLVRVAIGPLALGDLPKGAWRGLTPGEVAALASKRGSDP